MTNLTAASPHRRLPDEKGRKPSHWQENPTHATLETVTANMQLYLAAGLPTIAVLIGILLNAVLYNSLSTSLNARMPSRRDGRGS